MNEETFKKILYLILKVTIKNNGFLSQLEIFRDVRFLMNKYFNIKESDLVFKIGQGRSEDFKDILNFILTILCELALVSQKMENKSFYFKWNGFKGFRKKYLLEFINNNESNFEMSESFEHRIQIYTRMLLLELFKNVEGGILNDGVENLIKISELENQQRHTDKIHWLLKFIQFINAERGNNNILHHIFTLSTNATRGDGIVFKLNKLLIEISLIKDNNSSEIFCIGFNEIILNKHEQWSEEIARNEKLENNYIVGENNDVDFKYAYNTDNINMVIDNEAVNSICTKEISELDKFKINLNKFNNENEEVGFALLKGTKWCYYIKKLFCIIGRAPIKYGVNINSLISNNSGQNNFVNLTAPSENLGNTYWHVDIDLGQNRKISKQHALISYNFQTCSFEIQNISKKRNLKVNGEIIKYGEDMPLTSKSLISIGNQEFYFLLPL